jgi:hypothetical protein
MVKDMKRFIVSATVLAMLFAMVWQAEAGLIINNAGFESPVLTDGAFTVVFIPSWGITGGNAGVFNPQSIHITGEAPEGQNVGYSDAGDISQVLSDALSIGDYTLQVEVGDRKDVNFPAYKVQLLAGGNLLAEDNNSLLPNDGFLTSTVTYTALASDANLGQSLEIRLIHSGGSSQQIEWDDVRLDFVAIPEPSTFLLLLAGILGVLGIGWRRRRKAA